ncbi:hypothetical protein BDZ94DRAFT_1239141 [Collybia nuda]|uniref:Uncharacterized protein n=1 Tax=Collybia nuda TaxID=64659 RepID=A0A9P6CG37_9AGAR|nr:hypothetical protein BDZ94DRAFT_1239141 [Collybia nuda]
MRSTNSAKAKGEPESKLAKKPGVPRAKTIGTQPNCLGDTKCLAWDREIVCEMLSKKRIHNTYKLQAKVTACTTIKGRLTISGGSTPIADVSAKMNGVYETGIVIAFTVAAAGLVIAARMKGSGFLVEVHSESTEIIPRGREPSMAGSREDRTLIPSESQIEMQPMITSPPIITITKAVTVTETGIQAIMTQWKTTMVTHKATTVLTFTRSTKVTGLQRETMTADATTTFTVTEPPATTATVTEVPGIMIQRETTTVTKTTEGPPIVREAITKTQLVLVEPTTVTVTDTPGIMIQRETATVTKMTEGPPIVRKAVTKTQMVLVEPTTTTEAVTMTVTEPQVTMTLWETTVVTQVGAVAIAHTETEIPTIIQTSPTPGAILLNLGFGTVGICVSMLIAGILVFNKVKQDCSVEEPRVAHSTCVAEEELAHIRDKMMKAQEDPSVQTNEEELAHIPDITPEAHEEPSVRMNNEKPIGTQISHSIEVREENLAEADRVEREEGHERTNKGPGYDTEMDPVKIAATSDATTSESGTEGRMGFVNLGRSGMLEVKSDTESDAEMVTTREGMEKGGMDDNRSEIVEKLASGSIKAGRGEQPQGKSGCFVSKTASKGSTGIVPKVPTASKIPIAGASTTRSTNSAKAKGELESKLAKKPGVPRASEIFSTAKTQGNK